MDNRLLKIILEELSNSLKDKFNVIRDKFVSEGISLQEAEKFSAMLIIKEFTKKDFQDVVSKPANMDAFIEKASDSTETFDKTIKDLNNLVDNEPMTSKGVAFLRKALVAKYEEKKQTGKLKTSTGDTPQPKSADSAGLEYLNRIQNMTSADRSQLIKTIQKNKEERDKVISALKTAAPEQARGMAKKFGIDPNEIAPKKALASPPKQAAPSPAAPSKPQPTAPKATVAPPKAPTVVPAAKKPTASATPTPTPKKKKAPPKPMTGAKARKFKQKYKDFTDGGDDKQISKKFTVSKADKEKLPKFGKVGKQVKGGSEKQAAGRDTSATAHVSGDNVPTGDKGDSVSCLRGRVMSKDLWNKREAIGMEIMGGGKNKKTGKPLPFGRNRWSDGVKRDDVADAKAIKSVINFMGAAARYGYDPVKYWPNFLWATATHLVLKGQPKSKECLDPRKPKDVETHRKLQAQKKSKIADGVDITIKEDFCLEGCTEEQIQEANSKRNVKNIEKYKEYVANLRQKSKGMNLDQFLDLIKYKE